MFDFEVHGLADEAQAKAVVSAFDELIRVGEGLEPHEVGLGWSVEDGRYWVSGETDYPIRVVRSRYWRPHFEAVLRAGVEATAPGATFTINWRYPDDD